MAHIEYFMSPLSPFTYLAGDRLEKVAQKRSASITYKPFDVVGNFARTGGTAPAERHQSRKTYRLQELSRVARHHDLPINLQPAHWPTNPAPSSYAIIAAQNAGSGNLGALVQAFLSACWAEEKNIADEQVVRACLSGAGFDPDLADKGLAAGAETFSANTEEAVRRGVFGAPSYLVGEELFWGQDRLSYLDDFLSDAP